MAKLYWRVKRDGKWTWRKCFVLDKDWSKEFQQYVQIVAEDTSFEPEVCGCFPPDVYCVDHQPEDSE